MESGLGPLLRRCSAGDPRAKASPLWPILAGADLTARMIAAEQIDAIDEIVQACGMQVRQVEPPTLLKGISVSGQVYPGAHLRPMRDIDLLIDEDAIPAVESVLLELGYQRRPTEPPEFYRAHHHTAPFFHPWRKLWLEVHRALFSVRSPVGSDRVFSVDNVKAARVRAELRGRLVNRLSDELQIIYVASHWAYGSGFVRVGGMVAMLDMIYLLRNARSVRWEQILDWLDGSVACTPVYLLLTYLDRYGLVDLPAGVLGGLSRRQRSFGRASLKMLHAMIDRYVTDGCEFGALVSERSFYVLWRTLTLPQRPSRKLPLVLWNLLPSRGRLARLAMPRSSSLHS